MYFSINSHRDVILTTQYNLWLNQLAVFCCIQKCVRTQKKWLYFVICIKLPQDSTIGCTFFLGGVDYIGKALKTKIKFNYKLCFYSNTFNSCIQNKIQTMVELARCFLVCTENMSGRKNICLCSVTRTKLPQDSTIGCTSVFGHVWEILAKALKIKIKFNYKLYFYSNTFNSCIKNKIQPMVELTRCFMVVVRICNT